MLRYLTLIVPVALANFPVPPVTLPFVSLPVLILRENLPYRKPPRVSTVRSKVPAVGEVIANYNTSNPTILPAC